MKQIIFFSCLFLASKVLAVPISVISPSKVDQVNGYTISTTGTYLLSDDVIFNYAGSSVGAVSAFFITSSNVTLDLNGKSLTATTLSTGLISAIQILNGAGNVTIKNGTITSRNVAIVTVSNSLGLLLDNLILNNGISLLNLGSVIQNCTMRSAVSLAAGGSGHRITKCQLLEGATFNISGNNIVLKECSVERGALTTAGFVITGAGCVLENCVSVSCYSAPGTGTIGFSVSGNNNVLKNCSAYDCLTGFSINSGRNILQSCLAVGNSGNGVINNSSTGVVMGTISVANGLANYSGTGPLAYVQVNNGGQLPPGSVVDPQIDNISIV